MAALRSISRRYPSKATRKWFMLALWVLEARRHTSSANASSWLSTQKLACCMVVVSGSATPSQACVPADFREGFKKLGKRK
eukprot:CAMPEP_0202408066 /NCGR_PEP_ID=MMETSP1128-20130828/14013_1 /ASSEMBLY_ACC=CAM_ASM_000463 /TAXON_ID=3047 /ORGANISM="Dunaliella tertiolecta, Strain CCMP1320" /LENGTH=80 /DNA_ID=CAMNT_0049013171 /DNA_START=801 /DNA_END=1043 /DNA_ORIENTATION=-